MNTNPSVPPQRVSAEKALQALVASSAFSEGPPDFVALARRVAETFEVTSVVLVRRESLPPLAVWSRGQAHEGFVPAPFGTLLAEVFERGLHHCVEGAEASRPGDEWPRRLGRGGFLGMTLKGVTGEVLGAIALYEDGPLEVGPSDLALLDVFALRASVALERQREQPLAERLAKLTALTFSVGFEIKNPLAYVRANLNYLSEELARQDASALDLTELREAVGQALAGAERIRTVMNHITSILYPREEQGGK
ncbi:GAF domain-containing protein [Archangium minus]|uniref:GAF domain-containing protein n=1 Tax=Archangium minus TaxID=83450 RepID=UPI0037C1A9AB